MLPPPLVLGFQVTAEDLDLEKEAAFQRINSELRAEAKAISDCRPSRPSHALSSLATGTSGVPTISKAPSMDAQQERHKSQDCLGPVAPLASAAEVPSTAPVSGKKHRPPGPLFSSSDPLPATSSHSRDSAQVTSLIPAPFPAASMDADIRRTTPGTSAPAAAAEAPPPSTLNPTSGSLLNGVDGGPSHFWATVTAEAGAQRSEVRYNKRSQTSWTSSCPKQIATSSSYSSTGGLPGLKRRWGPASSHCQLTCSSSKTVSEDGPQAVSSGHTQCEKTADIAPGQTLALRNGSPRSQASRPRKRKLPLPSRRQGDPLMLPPPLVLGFQVTAEDLDLEKEAAFQRINSELRAEAKAISDCRPSRPSHALSSLATGTSGVPTISKAPSMDAQQERHKSQDCLGPVAPLASAAEVPSTAPVSGKKHRPPGPLFSSSDPLPATSSHSRDSAQVTSLIPAPFPAASMDADIRRTTPGTSAPAAAAEAPPPSTLNPTSGSLLNGVDGGPSHFWATVTAEAGAQRSEVRYNKRSQTSWMSSCPKQIATSSSYSSTGGLPGLKRRWGPASSHCQLTCSSSKTVSEDGPQAVSSGHTQCEKTADIAPGQTLALRNGSPRSQASRPRKRKLPLPSRRQGDPLMLPPPLVLGFQVTAEDLDLEKEAAFQRINSELRAEAKAISDCRPSRPSHALSSLATGTSGVPTISKAPSMDAQQERHKSQDCLGPVAPLASAAEVPSTAPVSGKKHRPPGPLFSSSDPLPATSSHSRDSAQVTSLIPAPFPAASMDADIRRTTPGTSAPAAAAEAPPPSTLNPTSGSLLNGVDGGPSHFWATVTAEAGAQRSEVRYNKRSQTSWTSSCPKQIATSSSYSSTGGLPGLKRRWGPASSHCQLTCSSSKTVSEDGPQAVSSGHTQCEKTADIAPGQTLALRNGSPRSQASRPRKRKLPLPSRRQGDPLMLPPPLVLGFQVTAEDLDLEKEAAFQRINSELRAEAKAISDCRPSRPSHALSSLATGTSGVPTISKAPSMDAQQERHKSQDCLGPVAPLASAAEVPSTAPVSGKKHRPPGPLFSSSDPLPATSSHSRDSAQVTSLIPAPFPAASMDADIRRTTPGTSAPAAAAEAPPPSTLNPTSGSLLNGVDGGPSHFWATVTAEAGAQRSEVRYNKRSQTSWTSSCPKQIATSSSYSSTGGLPGLKRRWGPASSHCQLTCSSSKTVSEDGPQAVSSGHTQCEKTADIAPGQTLALRNGSPRSQASRPRKRKLPLPSRRQGDPLMLPPPLELGFRVTAEDLDLEKEAAFQRINSELRAETRAILDCRPSRPSHTLSSLATGASGLPAISKAPSMDAQQERHKSQDCLGPVAPLASAAEVLSTAPVSGKKHRPPGPLFSSSDTCPATSSHSRDSAQVTSLIPAPFPAASMDAGIRRTRPGTSAPAAATAAPPPSTLNPTSGSLLNGVDGGPSHFWASAAAEAGAQRSEVRYNKRSQTSWTSSCTTRNAISSSYSSTGGLPGLKQKRGPASSHCQLTLSSSKTVSEDGPQAVSSGHTRCEKAADIAPGQTLAPRNGSPRSQASRPRRRKFPLLPRRRGEPLMLPPPLELGFRVTAEDLDLEKEAAFQRINSELRAEAKAISDCTQPCHFQLAHWTG
ncbi:putative POM121-like protein 1-like [Pongo abelii]|uniref:putative POM121-like protein 1-like n=1 Tax=Pongo abelii TaxID=9601 RepID=UPI003007CB11